jgi:hypothetical protein
MRRRANASLSLMQRDVMCHLVDFVFDLQLFALEFGEFRFIQRATRLLFLYFLLERLVTALEFDYVAL